MVIFGRNSIHSFFFNCQQMIPDVEIQERLSIDFAFDPSFQPEEPEVEDDEDEDEDDD